MEFDDIILGKKYWCVLKTTLVDPKEIQYPEFLVHLTCGYVTSKGLQKEAGGGEDTEVQFVEIAGQRVKYSYIFEYPIDAVFKATEMMEEIQNGTAPEPVTATTETITN